MSAGETSWYGEWIDPDTLPANVRDALDAPNLAMILEARRRQSPARTALTFLADGESAVGESLDYEGLVSAVFRTARALAKLGQTADKAVLFLGLPTTEGLIAFWGAQVFGPVWPVNPMLSLDQLHKLAGSMPVAAVVAPSVALAPEIHAKAAAVAEALVVPLVIADNESSSGTLSLPRLADGEPDHLPSGNLPSDHDIAACFPTGGTTGLPKVARLSHRNQIVGIVATALIHDPSEEIVTANGLPLFHVGGGVIATTRALVLGQTLVQLSPGGFRSRHLMGRFWDVARNHSISQVIAVPTVFSDLVDAWPGGTNPVRYFIAGASKLPASLDDRYQELFGIGIHEGYGMTECSGFATGNATGSPPRAGSAGRPLPFYEVRIAMSNGDGRIDSWCVNSERGRVVVRGPAVFAGYCEEAATRDKFLRDADGEAWLDSGDIGGFDAEGYLWLTGREKDIIIRGGHNIDAATIENCLLDHPAVADAAAVGMPDARLGELPIAFVALATGQSATEAELAEFARARVEEPAAAPVQVVILEALPRTAMNKIFKPALRRRALEMASEPFLPVGAPSDDAVRVILEDNGDLHVHLLQDLRPSLTDLEEFLSRISVRHSWGASLA